ncbi:hypothetical protein BC830DRAFT_1120037 [Chytriomyces sp. MP71]|nr:hypothetical protein BC830DRAFT_1120037 [Chytriomyces sp. MP71]
MAVTKRKSDEASAATLVAKNKKAKKAAKPLDADSDAELVADNTRDESEGGADTPNVDDADDGDQANQAEKEEKKKKRRNKGLAKKLKKKEEREKAEAVARETRKAQGLPETLPSAKNQASAYLREWDSDRLAWKFQKARQLWILRHILDTDNISPNDFSIAVRYCKELPEGTARQMTLEKAQQAIAEGLYKETVDKDAKGDGEETKDVENEAEGDVDTSKDTKKVDDPAGKKKKKKNKDAAEKKKPLTEEVLKRARKLVKVLQPKSKSK